MEGCCAYGYWWLIVVPALIMFYTYKKKQKLIFLFLGISLVMQFLSFLTMTGTFSNISWLKDPYNMFWGETLCMSFLLIGILSLYGVIGTLIGLIIGFIYISLWFRDFSGWYNRYRIIGTLIGLLSIERTYHYYKKKDKQFWFLIFFTISTLFVFIAYPLTFTPGKELFSPEGMRLLFLVITFIWSLIALFI